MKLKRLTILEYELQSRREKNPNYSMRAFARFLGVSVTSLSQALSMKRAFSFESAHRIAERLALSPNQTNKLLEELGVEITEEQEAREFREITDETFSLISNWYHFAILNLVKLPDIADDVASIAARLGIAEKDVAAAIDKMVSLGFILRRDGVLSASELMPSTRPDIPSESVQKYHLEVLNKAQSVLRGTPIPLRDYSAITFPADIANIPAAKNLIMKFKRRLARVLCTAENQSVYTLSIQLFPVAAGVSPESLS